MIFLKTIRKIILASCLLTLSNELLAQGIIKETPESTISITGSDIVKTVECTGNETVTIEGAGNTVTATGSCKAIIVTGTDNKVTANDVKIIRVQGVDNTITYRTSSNKNGKIVSSISGVDNSVKKLP